MLVILSISRRGSAIARWIETAITVVGFAFGAWGLITGIIRLEDITSVSWALQAVAIFEMALLWSPAMSKWIRKTGSVPVLRTTT